MQLWVKKLCVTSTLGLIALLTFGLIEPKDDAGAFESAARALDIQSSSEALLQQVPVAKLQQLRTQQNLRAQDLYVIGLASYFGRDGARSVKTGFELVKKAAEAGWGPAQFTLSRCYIRGDACERSAESAAIWLIEANDQGLPEAAWDLATLYWRGVAVPQDLTRAGDLLMSAAEVLEEARPDIFKFASENGLPTAPSEWRTWLEAGVAAKDPYAAYLLGMELYPGKSQDERERSESLLRSAASAGIAMAQYQLGSGLIQTAIEENRADGLKLIESAAAQSYGPAEALMGWCYQYGPLKATSTAAAEAEKWYRSATSHHEPSSFIRLGHLYLERGLVELASQVFRVAAVDRNLEAQFTLSLLLEDHPELQVAEAESSAWLFDAANAGHADAELRLGRRIADPKASASDPEQANRLFRSAADHGSADAAMEMGESYTLGRGTSPSAVEAARWYKRAAVMGSDAGALRLAEVLMRGQGIARDLQASRTILQSLVQQGVERAASVLKELESLEASR